VQLKHAVKAQTDNPAPPQSPKLKLWLVATLIGTGLVLSGACAHAEVNEPFSIDKLLALGTSPKAGAFYSFGSTLCRLVNLERKNSLIRCTVHPSPGAEYNTRAVVLAEFDLGMSRSDILYEEYSNTTGNDDINGDVLRAVMSLNPVPVMMIAKRTLKMTDLPALRGKKLNLGNEGSGQRNLVDSLLKALRIGKADLGGTADYSPADEVEAFCRNDVEVILSAYGNPSPQYRRMLDECDGEIVPMSGATSALLVKADPLLHPMAIPGGIYRSYPDSIQTLGFHNVLFTTKNTSAESIKRFLGSVVKHLPVLAASDPRLNFLSVESVFTQGITVPLHEGVIQYLLTASSWTMPVNSLQLKP
jgi:TRAP transporter TAXI family solute receptor